MVLQDRTIKYRAVGTFSPLTDAVNSGVDKLKSTSNNPDFLVIKKSSNRLNLEDNFGTIIHIIL